MKRPFETVRELLFNRVIQNKEHTKSLIEQVDKLMVWIVGFSVGGLSLIVSDIAKANQNFSHSLIKAILILLALSVTTGILFRIACYLIQIYNNQIQVFIETSFSNNELMEIAPEDLSAETDIREVIRRLNSDFGEDFSNISELHSKSAPSIQNELLNDLKDHYKKTGQWAKKDYDLAIGFARDTMQKAYGLSEDQMEKLFNEDTSSKWKFWTKIAYVTFLTSCLAFISVIVILCTSY